MAASARRAPGDSEAGGRGLRSNVDIAPTLLTAATSAAFLGVSVRKFHELRGEPWAPAPIVLGPRLLRWSRAELEAAVAAMPRQSAAGAEPAQLLRGRIERAKSTGSLAP